MEDSWHAEALHEAQWQNLDGIEVSKKDLASSSKVSLELTAADMVLFVDEVGSNKCMKDDGNKGGK